MNLFSEMKQDQILMQTMASLDYEKFKLMKGNRFIKENHVRRIMYSMQKKQLIVPVIVNEKMEIIDGQHRYTACKRLGLPVPYIVNEGYNINDVILMNTEQENWKNEDFMNKFISENYADYVYLYELIKKHQLKYFDLFKIIAKTEDLKVPMVGDLFRTGELRISNKDDLEDFLNCYEDLRSEVPKHKTGQFVSAFLEVYFISAPFEYNHQQMLDGYTRYGYELKDCKDKHDVLALLCNRIYTRKGMAPSKTILYNAGTKKFHKAI